MLGVENRGRWWGGKIFFSIQYAAWSRSNELGCVTARLTTSSDTSEVYWMVKPSSAFALSASSLNWLTPVPAMRSVTGSSAKTKGKPVIAPEPAATPAADAALARTRRRVVPILGTMHPSPFTHFRLSFPPLTTGIVPDDDASKGWARGWR